MIDGLERVDWRIALYAVLSLTVVRMVPVAVSMIGTGFGRPATLFIGWFGPRGLASVVFGLLIVEELPADDARVRTGALHDRPHRPAQCRRPRDQRRAVVGPDATAGAAGERYERTRRDSASVNVRPPLDLRPLAFARPRRDPAHL